MMNTSPAKLTSVVASLLVMTAILGCKIQSVPGKDRKHSALQEIPSPLYERSLHDFTLNSGEEYQLLNSAIKQDYTISFSGDIVNFDTLIIGKGDKRYLSSYILINRDSIIFNRITHTKTRKAHKHNLSLEKILSIQIDRTVNAAILTLINEEDTLKIPSDFVGMNRPFIRSLGSTIYVNEFEFSCEDYFSDVFVFGDSYVNCGSAQRWPYYLYQERYTFLCDGLPGGRSGDSYDFLQAAFSVHIPEYVIWCLGMNDGSDEAGAQPNWLDYMDKVMDLCAQHDVTLILTTVPSVPSRDHTEKNKFVRASGYRYIDFDKAVSDGKGNWKKGMLAKDEVHPTAMGAARMAEALLQDFPEMADYVN